MEVVHFFEPTFTWKCLFTGFITESKSILYLKGDYSGNNAGTLSGITF